MAKPSLRSSCDVVDSNPSFKRRPHVCGQGDAWCMPCARLSRKREWMWSTPFGAEFGISAGQKFRVCAAGGARGCLLCGSADKGRTMSSPDTPMFRQYMELKSQHTDAVLFFRMGDFYELFFDDAKLAAEACELTLTSRNKKGPKSDSHGRCASPRGQRLHPDSDSLGSQGGHCRPGRRSETSQGHCSPRGCAWVSPGVLLDPEDLHHETTAGLWALFPANRRGFGLV